MTAPEACDDNNLTDGDGCNADCGVPLCGDGVVAGTEQCDDGNTVDGDCCTSGCRWPVCTTTSPVVNPAKRKIAIHLLQNSSWLDAEAEAICLGGHLVTINDEAENAWVWGQFSRFGREDRNLLIGLNDAAVEGTFVWTSGEPVTYTHWRVGQPDNAFGTEDYAHLRVPDGSWNDIPGDQLRWDEGPTHGVVELTDCGNGRIDPGEECEDGNLDPRDGCTNACTICGNGVVTPYEQCDDGNLTDHDGCNADCRLSICGDGVTDPDEGCDDRQPRRRRRLHRPLHQLWQPDRHAARTVRRRQ